jgi:hypothetical protein
VKTWRSCISRAKVIQCYHQCTATRQTRLKH